MQAAFLIQEKSKTGGFMKKKRFIAWFLCMVMVMSMLVTACGKDKEKDSDDEDDKKTEQVSPETTPSPKPTPTSEPKAPVDEDTVFDYEKGISVLTLEQDDAFDQYLNELYLTLITTDSFTLHFKMQNPSEYGIDLDYTYGDADSDFSDTFISKIEEGLDQFDYDLLTESQQIMYDLLAYELDMYNQGKDFDDFYIWNLAQNNNLISGLQSLFTEYSIQSEQDAKDFTALLSMLPDYLEDAQQQIEEQNENGVCLTEAMLDMSIEMAEDWLSDTPEENIIYVAFEVNLQEAQLEDELEEEYLEALAKLIDEEMVPAVEDYIDFLETLEDDVVEEAKGLCYFDGGEEYYAWLLESYLGAGMTPDELFNYISDKYEETWDRIFEISEEHPMALATFMMAGSKYSDDPEEIMEALAELAKEELPDVGDLSWIISYLDEKQEVESIAAYYLSPQLDNIGRRVIRVNGSNVSDSVSLFTTLAHEGIPGHLYQDEYTLRSEGYQELNSALTYLGYQEGWAMYVEKLAYGWCLENEVNAELYNLNTMLSYMMISIADLGINYKGWTYDEFCQWMAEQGFSDEETLDYVYNMAISDPGLYPAYGFGYLLMEDTVNELVESGDTPKEAYAKILDVGCSPYTVLWEHLGIDPID